MQFQIFNNRQVGGSVSAILTDTDPSPSPSSSRDSLQNPSRSSTGADPSSVRTAQRRSKSVIGNIIDEIKSRPVIAIGSVVVLLLLILWMSGVFSSKKSSRRQRGGKGRSLRRRRKYRKN